MRFPLRQVSSVGIAATLVCALQVGECPGATGTAIQTLNATISPIAKLSVPASVILTVGSSKFSSYRANLTVSYRARTLAVGGGTITVQVTSDFAPAGGPSVAAGALTYTCGGASLGNACSGTQTASTLQTPVLALPASACTGGGGACSSQDPNSVTINLSVPDDPTYATGSYSATLKFVISAT